MTCSARFARRPGSKSASSPTLSRFGRTDVAYTLLSQETHPSWLYPVKHGATTIWERWDGWTEERGFQDPGMNSFNHYAYGAVGQWLYATVAGIELDPDLSRLATFLTRAVLLATLCGCLVCRAVYAGSEGAGPDAVADLDVTFIERTPRYPAGPWVYPATGPQSPGTGEHVFDERDMTRVEMKRCSLRPIRPA